jgi:hypothetical protein
MTDVAGSVVGAPSRAAGAGEDKASKPTIEHTRVKKK